MDARENGVSRRSRTSIGASGRSSPTASPSPPTRPTRSCRPRQRPSASTGRSSRSAAAFSPRCWSTPSIEGSADEHRQNHETQLQAGSRTFNGPRADRDPSTDHPRHQQRRRRELPRDDHQGSGAELADADQALGDLLPERGRTLAISTASARYSVSGRRRTPQGHFRIGRPPRSRHRRRGHPAPRRRRSRRPTASAATRASS